MGGKILALEEVPEDPRPHGSNHHILPPQWCCKVFLYGCTEEEGIPLAAQDLTL